jgi:hypothetical protein
LQKICSYIHTFFRKGLYIYTFWCLKLHTSFYPLSYTKKTMSGHRRWAMSVPPRSVSRSRYDSLAIDSSAYRRKLGNQNNFAVSAYFGKWSTQKSQNICSFLFLFYFVCFFVSAMKIYVHTVYRDVYKFLVIYSKVFILICFIRLKVISNAYKIEYVVVYIITTCTRVIGVNGVWFISCNIIFKHDISVWSNHAQLN